MADFIKINTTLINLNQVKQISVGESRIHHEHIINNRIRSSPTAIIVEYISGVVEYFDCDNRYSYEEIANAIYEAITDCQDSDVGDVGEYIYFSGDEEEDE